MSAIDDTRDSTVKALVKDIFGQHQESWQEDLRGNGMAVMHAVLMNAAATAFEEDYEQYRGIGKFSENEIGLAMAQLFIEQSDIVYKDTLKALQKRINLLLDSVASQTKKINELQNAVLSEIERGYAVNGLEQVYHLYEVVMRSIMSGHDRVYSLKEILTINHPTLEDLATNLETLCIWRDQILKATEMD